MSCANPRTHRYLEEQLAYQRETLADAEARGDTQQVLVCEAAMEVCIAVLEQLDEDRVDRLVYFPATSTLPPGVMSRPVLSEADVQALLAACRTPEERLLVDVGLHQGARASEVGALMQEPLTARLVQFKFRRIARRAGVEACFYHLRRTWRARQGVES